MREPIRVLVVDDSALMRQLVTDILNSDPTIRVVGKARDGLDALEKIPRLKPDVVTMDVEMPRLDGLSTLERIVTQNPLPVVMLSALTTRGAETTIRALELGAIDFAAKPHTAQQGAVAALARDLPFKVKAAARVDLKRIQRPAVESKPAVKVHPTDFSPEVVVIGVSTGGPSALHRFLSELPASFPLGIMIAQHMPPGFTSYLAKRLDSVCQLRVKEARQGDVIEPGLALIAPAGYHLQVEGRLPKKTVKVTPGGREPYKPSVDILFASAAKAWGRNVLAIIMTGMGRDGSSGLQVIKKQGGYVLAESRETCIVYGMPQAAVKSGVVDEVLPLHHLASRVCQITAESK